MSPSNKLENSIHNSPKKFFFSYETIKELDQLNNFFAKSNSYLFATAKLKYRCYPLFLQMLLLLSGDISPNPGPRETSGDKIWEPFKKRGLHLLHININSLLPKIDELRSITLKTSPAILGVTETKLDDSIQNSEVHIENYNLIRCDRNRKGGGVACYVRNDLNFSQKCVFSRDVENVFIDILLPKSKAFTVGIFYRPPNKYNFIDLINDDFNNLNAENNDLFILGDMNINLLNKNFFGKNSHDVTTCPLLKKYKEFVSSFGLKQLIRQETRVTCNSASLIDHILTNASEKISQSGVIDTGLSDHQLIFCTRKILKLKSGETKYVNYRSMKNYTKESFKEKLQNINFPDYERFQSSTLAYSDFINKLTDTIDDIAPMKQSKIKNSSQEWFDGEIAEKIAIRDKLFAKFKKNKTSY